MGTTHQGSRLRAATWEWKLSCRGGQIRTADLTDPNRARYQTALRPDWR